MEKRSITECIDPELGVLLHAYELRVLPEEGIEKFEIHLLSCAHCLEQLQRFTGVTSQLRDSDFVKELISNEENYNEITTSSAGTFRKYLWPDAPLVFKPGFAYFVLLLTVSSILSGLWPPVDDGIRHIQHLQLTPARSASSDTIQLSPGRDILASFVFREAVPDVSYSVTIVDENGTAVVWEEDFKGFDEYETGRMLIPEGLLKPGNYKLIIVDSKGAPPSNTREYSFTVED